MKLRWLICAALLAMARDAHALAALRALDGPTALSQYGFACAVVGDMDGDGWSEYAIGASADSVPGRSAGRVFVFRGGDAHASDPPAWVIDGAPGDFLGFALAPAGDQDGDGLADLLIGAPGNTDVDPTLAGRVLVAYGSSALGLRAPLMISGIQAGSRFGEAVTTCDLDGDGIQDIVIGAPGFHDEAGEVRGFHGRTAPAAPWFSLHGAEAGDEFGSALAGAGSTRGGAYEDLLVGAPYHSDYFVWSGRVSLYLGGATPDTIPDAAWQGDDDADLLGWCVAGAGDVNADGRDDFVLGAPGANAGTMIDAGRASLYLGAPLPPAAPSVVVSGSLAYGELGLRAAGIGDANGDGIADWAVGMPGSPDAFTSGRVNIHFGRPVPVAAPDLVLSGEELDDMFGHALSGGGRLSSFSGDQFLVGADEHASRGRVYLFGNGPAAAVAADRRPDGVRLLAPLPNPSRDAIRIAYELDRPRFVQIAVHDVMGRRIAILARGETSAGRHELRWAPSRAGTGAGVYWVVLTTSAGEPQARRVVLISRAAP